MRGKAEGREGQSAKIILTESALAIVEGARKEKGGEHRAADILERGGEKRGGMGECSLYSRSSDRVEKEKGHLSKSRGGK